MSRVPPQADFGFPLSVEAVSHLALPCAGERPGIALVFILL